MNTLTPLSEGSRIAYYRDPTWLACVQYESNYVPKPKESKETFLNLIGLIDKNLAKRLIRCRKDGDYSGFNRRGCSHLASRLTNEQYMLANKKNLKHLTHSINSVRDSSLLISPRGELRKELGMTEVKRDPRIWTTMTWAKNGLNGKQYRDSAGRRLITHNAVTSSYDLSSRKIAMMRAVDDYEGRAVSIGYTGRPETKAKALEQIEYMFMREMNKGEDRKGITKVSEDLYEFTYVVNNLMNPYKQLSSIKREGKVLESLNGTTITIAGRHVRIKPLYFTQMFDKELNLSDLGLKRRGSESSRNAKGYDTLLKLAENATNVPEEDRPLLQAAITHLKDPTKLLPEAELFYRDLIAKIINLPMVFHCENSVDRTTIALALSMALHQWRKLSLSFDPSAPHQILELDSFKQLFAANIMSGHQVARVAHEAEGLKLKENPIALRLMPDHYKKTPPSYKIGFFKMMKAIVGIANFFFSRVTSSFSEKLTYLQNAYRSQQFNKESPYIKDRYLFASSKLIKYAG